MNKLCPILIFVACALSGSKTCPAQEYYFTTFAGIGAGSSDGSGADVAFSVPRGVAIDKAGNMFVADSRNNTIRKITPAGVVSTFAGSPGNAGHVDGAGQAARFSRPAGVAVDSAGTIYVSDTQNFAIRKITADGSVTTLAGGTLGSNDGNGAAAQFGFPQGLAVDGAGNIYVADSSNNTIRKVSPGGDVTTLAGSPGPFGNADGTGSNARFYGPSAVAVDSAGNVYVADEGNCNIRKITPGGVVSTLAGSGSLGFADGTGRAAQFGFPSGIVVDSSGVVYVADTFNYAVRKMTPDGVVTTFAGSPGFHGSTDGKGNNARFWFDLPVLGVAVDPSGNIYVADTFNNTIRRITSDAVVTTLAGSASVPGVADGTGRAARFNSPRGAAVDALDNIYVADYGNFTIRKITPGAAVSTLAGVPGLSGSVDGPANQARFGGPKSVAVDRTGNVFVADTDNYTIRKITPDGVVSTLAGLAGSKGSTDGTGSAARFSLPSGVAVDDAGNIYVGDVENSTIRKISPGGVVTTIAGLAGSVGSIDGTGSAARFQSPVGVAVDKSGIIYVADPPRLRKITPAGVVTTLTKTGWPSSSSGGIQKDAVGPPDLLSIPGARGMAVDNAGNLYVTDEGATGNTVSKITPAGIVVATHGSGFGGNEDGSGFEAYFSGPAGVAVDSGGNIFVSDTGNNSIRVGVPLVSKLLNIATRLRVNPDPNQLIGGFIITGSEPKKVLIRAIGPSLSSFFSGALADPTLELFQGSTLLESNDNWKLDNRAAIEATLIPPTHDLESAIVRTLAPGAYTAIVRGKGGASGIGLVEVYELNQTARSKLANIATRGFVDTNDNVMIGGFIVGNYGSLNSRVVVRAIGPSLSAFGIPGALQDPTLELKDANGSTLISNDDWKQTQEAEITQTGLAPTDIRESALVISLSDGNYTAIVRGKGNTTGVGLVEVYNVP